MFFISSLTPEETDGMDKDTPRDKKKKERVTLRLFKGTQKSEREEKLGQGSSRFLLKKHNRAINLNN